MSASGPPAAHEQHIAALLGECVDADSRVRVMARLSQIVSLTLEKNQQLNLTADDTPELFWPRHIEDSLHVARELPREFLNGRIADVGSGGGIPGLVWGVLWPGASVELIESRQRRTAWLAEAAAALECIKLRVHTTRAEEAGQASALRERFDLVTARALARFATLAELTLPLLRVGGCMAAIKSADCREEIREAAEALRELGSVPDAVEYRPYTRSDGKACAVILVRKLAPTPPLYPRRAGIPAKHPL